MLFRSLYGRRNRLGDGLDMMQYFKESSVVRHGASTKEVALSFQGPIVVGRFVDVDRPDFLGLMNQQLGRSLRAQYSGCEGDDVRS